MKDRRAPRGGVTNKMQGWLNDWEAEKEAREDALAEARGRQEPEWTDGDDWLWKRSEACP
jgi:hypothetical protein